MSEPSNALKYLVREWLRRVYQVIELEAQGNWAGAIQRRADRLWDQIEFLSEWEGRDE